MPVDSFLHSTPAVDAQARRELEETIYGFVPEIRPHSSLRKLCVSSAVPALGNASSSAAPSGSASASAVPSAGQTLAPLKLEGFF